jgi:hypothetical protein
MQQEVLMSRQHRDRECAICAVQVSNWTCYLTGQRRRTFVIVNQPNCRVQVDLRPRRAMCRYWSNSHFLSSNSCEECISCYPHYLLLFRLMLPTRIIFLPSNPIIGLNRHVFHPGDMCHWTKVVYCCGHLRHTVRGWCFKYADTQKRCPTNVVAR